MAMPPVCPPQKTVREILVEESVLVRKWMLGDSDFKPFAILVQHLFPADIQELEVAILDIVPARHIVASCLDYWRRQPGESKPANVEEIYKFVDILAECRGPIISAMWAQLRAAIPPQQLQQVTYGNWAFVAFALDRFIGLMVPQILPSQ
jgi:hypothetical protein